MSGWVNGSKTPIYKGDFKKVEISLLIPSPSSNYKIFLACNHVLYHYCCVHFLFISVISLMSIFFPMEDVHKADKKHPVQKTPFMALAPWRVRHCFQWETLSEGKGKCKHETIFGQRKTFLEKSEKCNWQKSRQDKYSHNKQL